MPIDREEVEELRRRAEDDPVGAIEEMRAGNTELIDRFGRADTLPFLQTWFTEVEPGWQMDVDRSGALGAQSVGIEWSFHGVHDTDGAFNGLAASMREVDVRGFSIIGMERDRLQVRRYVDWAGLFAQLHLTLNWRMPLSNE